MFMEKQIKENQSKNSFFEKMKKYVIKVLDVLLYII